MKCIYCDGTGQEGSEAREARQQLEIQGFEKNLIEEALQRSEWKKGKAAKLLNINRATLVEKMKQLNIPS